MQQRQICPSADVAEQGYDFYDQAVSYNDFREDAGRSSRSWTERLPLVLQPRHLRTSSGEWKAKELSQLKRTFQDAGYNLTVDVRGAQTETDEEGQLDPLNGYGK